MKAINYKMKKLTNFVYSSKESPRDLPSRPKHALRLQKDRQIVQKSKISLLFFCEKPVSKPVNS